MAGFLCVDVAEANTRAFTLAYEYETLLGIGHAIYLLRQMLNQDTESRLLRVKWLLAIFAH